MRGGRGEDGLGRRGPLGGGGRTALAPLVCWTTATSSWDLPLFVPQPLTSKVMIMIAVMIITLLMVISVVCVMARVMVVGGRS